jgi:hypothetical protein
MYAVSTKGMTMRPSALAGPREESAATLADPFPPAMPSVAEVAFSRNMLDCNRVLTTSNGEVTMAPHIPPSLYTRKESDIAMTCDLNN